MILRLYDLNFSCYILVDYYHFFAIVLVEFIEFVAIKIKFKICKNKNKKFSIDFHFFYYIHVRNGTDLFLNKVRQEFLRDACHKLDCLGYVV